VDNRIDACKKSVYVNVGIMWIPACLNTEDNDKEIMKKQIKWQKRATPHKATPREIQNPRLKRAI